MQMPDHEPYGLDDEDFGYTWDCDNQSPEVIDTEEDDDDA